MQDAIGILRCPETHRPLRLSSNGLLSNGENTEYRVLDGVAVLTPDAALRSTDGNITDYYDSFGWETDDDGISKETKVALDTRNVAFEHTKKCISRLRKYFVRGGAYLLDMGSGSIPHNELMAYHSRFQKRVCVDLSIKALQQAKSKLGNRGVYIVGDAINLPLQDDSIDAITCNHVVYQIPAGLQATAIMELWRVLKPGGVAVVVYRWSYSGLVARLERIATHIGMKSRGGQTEAWQETPSAPARNPDHPQPRAWFETQNWPFEYFYDCFRIVDNDFMRHYVSDDWRGKAFLNALYGAQLLIPKAAGKYGTFPAIVIRKPNR